jgi:arginyl-tRNA synthetase
MNTLINELNFLFAPSLPTEVPLEITPSTQDQFGHYQCNTAMKLGKILKKNPRQVAEEMVAKVKENPHYEKMIAKLEIAGPGFINITLTPHYLSQYVDAMLHHSHLGIDHPQKPKRIIVDFSSPNTAKEMHVGHLRSTIIGDSLARLFEFLGHDVLRLNHVGDWGTAFGMLIAFMKEQAPDVLTGKQPTDLKHLMGWYKASKECFDKDPAFKKSSQLEVVALQSGDPTALKAWGIICEISQKAYQEIYNLLDVKIKERGESFYQPYLAALIEDLESKKLIQISDGAKCVFLEGFQNREGEPLPLMVQKSDGGYNYDTTDLAAIRQRIEEEKADRIIYVTDSGQSLHFQMIFKAAEKAGYLDTKRVRVDHVPFGLVLGADGKKFRTRSGETEKLIDLLNAAVEYAKKVFAERNPDLDPKERDYLAEIVGIGAVKYADLSSHRVSDYMFSYERMLRLEGNTAAFLLYSYVRVLGIKRKVQIDVEALIKDHHITLEHSSEIALGLHLARFAETLDLVAEELLPNRLSEYLYILAEKFNAFFRDCRVEGSKEQNSRLLLCELVARVLSQGLNILCLKTVDKM